MNKLLDYVLWLQLGINNSVFGKTLQYLEIE